MKKRSLKERFLEKTVILSKKKCWLWSGSQDGRGYGHLGRGIGTKIIKAHRASYIIFVGKIPKGFMVCHKCDVPSCVNPNHLFIGTSKDNANDRDRKGRQKTPLGEKHGKSVLTAKLVRKIRKEYSPIKGGYALLSRKYGLDPSHVRSIVNHKIWRSV